MSRYLPVALDVRGRRALVVGGDCEAADKARRLAAAGARVDVVWPSGCVELSRLAVRRTVHWYVRPFTPGDARGCRLVVLAERDPGLAMELRSLGRRTGFWLSAVDQPEHCDWVSVGIVEAGPVTVAVSSGGTAPALVRRLREGLEEGLDARFGRFADRFGRRREELAGRAREPRRQALSRLLEGLTVTVTVAYPAWEADPEDAHGPTGA